MQCSPWHLFEMVSAPGFSAKRQSGATSQPASTLTLSINNPVLSSAKLVLGYPLLLTSMMKPYPRPKPTIFPSHGSSKAQTGNVGTRRKSIWGLQDKTQAMKICVMAKEQVKGSNKWNMRHVAKGEFHHKMKILFMQQRHPSSLATPFQQQMQQTVE